MYKNGRCSTKFNILPHSLDLGDVTVLEIGLDPKYDDITQPKQCHKLSANIIDIACASRIPQTVCDDGEFRPTSPSVEFIHHSVENAKHDVKEKVNIFISLLVYYLNVVVNKDFLSCPTFVPE